MSRSLVCLIVCVLGSVSPSWAAEKAPVVKVEYRVSRVHGLLQFAMAVSGIGWSSAGLKEVWVRSRFQTPEVKKAVEDLGSIQNSMTSGWNFNSPVASRPDGANVDSVLITQSLYSRDLADFATRTLELLPMNDQRLLLKSLKTLEPVYEELVWKAGSQDLLVVKKKLESLAVKANLNSMFVRAVHFYRGSWPSDVPFVIGLHAIPFLKDFKNATSSTSFSSVEVHGVQTGAKITNVESDFGVVFHELCHSIYKSQPDESKADLEKWFVENKSPYASLAYHFLNEGLATALGNGWAFKNVSGKLDSTDWYNQKTIDTYGKLLYPIVSEYLEKNRAIDREFVTRAIQGFAEKLPESISSFENLMNRTMAIHNGSVLKNTDLREARNLLRSSSYSGGAPFMAQETINDVNSSSGALLIVLGPKDQSDFEKFAGQIPFISGRAHEIKKMPSRSYYASSSVDGRLLLVIKAGSLEDFRASLDAMKKRGSLTPGQSVYSY